MRSSTASCQSLLLAAARPFYWVLALFAASPPPCLTFDAPAAGKRYRHAVGLLYALHSLALLLLSVWTSYINNVVVGSFIESFQLGSLTNVLSRGQSMAVCAVQVLSMLVTTLRFQHLQRIFVAVEQLEHDIRWRSLQHRLGAPSSASCRGFSWQLARKSGCLLLFTCVSHTCTNYQLVAPVIPLPGRLLTGLTAMLIQMKSVEFCLMVQQVHLLLQQLMAELQFTRKQLMATRQHAERRCLYAALQRNQHWLGRVWSLGDSLESYFAVPLMALFLLDGLAITDAANWAYINLSLDMEGVSSSMRLFFTANLLVNMMVPCWLCQSCSVLYERFAGVLHNLRADGADARLSRCLREYSLQLVHQRLLFSCGGFFDINLRNFGARVLTITTFVVVLIQFRLQAEAEKAREGAGEEA